MKQKKSMTIIRPQDRDEHVSNRHNSNFWVKVLNEDTETGQRNQLMIMNWFRKDI